MTANSFLAWEWAVSAFGHEHCSDPKVRSLRLCEEAVELAQSLDVDKEKLHLLIDTVYSRPKGDHQQELGGVAMTFAVICHAFGTDPDRELERELDRVLAIPLEKFAKRNQDKIDLGLA